MASMIHCSATFATDWTLYDQSHEYSADMAVMCKQWNLTIFAPGEKPACSWGNLFVVDLESKKIYYAINAALGLPKDKFNQRMSRDTLLDALKSNDGYTQLDTLRGYLLTAREQARQKNVTEAARVEMEKARQAYLDEYQAATSIGLITAFENRYRDTDLDELIPRLQQKKAELARNAYLGDHAAISSSATASAFIEKYESQDPDRLVPAVKYRLVQLLKQEETQRKQAELQALQMQKTKANDEARAADDSKKARLQHIAGLQRKYRDNLIFSSAGAKGIVMTYAVACPTKETRSLPLKNLIFTQMDQVNRMGGTAKFFVENRGNEIRIFQAIYKDGKSMGNPEIAYEINSWGEMRPYALTKMALLNTCYGSAGPIWITPQD